MTELTVIKTERQTPIEIALQVDSQGMTTAKALYEFLQLNPKSYSRWAKTNIEKNIYYEEGKDWKGILHGAVNPLGGRPTKEYQLTTDFAKHLAMSSQSSRGKEAREYFIMVEQNLKQVATTLSKPQTQLEVIAMLAQQMVDKERMDIERDRQLRLQASRLDQVEAKIEKRITEDFSLQLVNPSQIGKMFEPAISAQEVNNRLREGGYQWKSGGEWIASVEGKKYSSSEPVQLLDGKMIYRLRKGIG